MCDYAQKPDRWHMEPDDLKVVGHRDVTENQKKEVDRFANKLSTDLMVACEIYHHNINKQPIWLSKLVEIFDDRMSKFELFHSIDALMDWMLVYHKAGPTSDGRCGYVLYIDDDATPGIKELYEKYWKDVR
jgi:hypothetical protein